MSGQGDLFAWPQRPPALIEQTVASLPGATIQGNYDAWRRTTEGTLAFNAFVRRALASQRQGERLSAKALCEAVRAELKMKLNNSFTALLAREAESAEAVLAGAFEKRQRKAA